MTMENLGLNEKIMNAISDTIWNRRLSKDSTTSDFWASLQSRTSQSRAI